MVAKRARELKEAEIEQAVCDYAKSIGCLAVKLRADGDIGFPDRTIFTARGVMFIEFKTPRGRLRKRQEVWIDYLRRLGFKVEIVTSVRQGERVINTFLEEQKALWNS